VAPYVSPIIDTATLALVCKDLGLAGRTLSKVINGRQYIAFSGYPGLRTLFPGTIYSANNRKIIKMAIGALGIKRMVRIGGILTFCITVSLTILEAFLREHSTCYDLVGNIAADLIKIGIPALMCYIAGIIAGGFTTIAFWPIVVAISISVFVGFRIDAIDDKHQLTEKLAVALEKLGQEIEEKQEQLQKVLGLVPHAIERGIIWRALGADIDNLLP